ncbi:hypothetical protein Tco_0492199 [Tanacetum coccineum]
MGCQGCIGFYFGIARFKIRRTVRIGALQAPPFQIMCKAREEPEQDNPHLIMFQDEAMIWDTRLMRRWDDEMDVVMTEEAEVRDTKLLALPVVVALQLCPICRRETKPHYLYQAYGLILRVARLTCYIFPPASHYSMDFITTTPDPFPTITTLTAELLAATSHSFTFTTTLSYSPHQTRCTTHPCPTSASYFHSTTTLDEDRLPRLTHTPRMGLGLALDPRLGVDPERLRWIMVITDSWMRLFFMTYRGAQLYRYRVEVTHERVESNGFREIYTRRREEMRELRAADRTRQQQIIQTLTAVQTLQRETIPLQGLVTTLQGQVTALQGQVMTLQGQVTVLQGQQGPAGGPAQPGLPEDTGSSS